MMRCNLAVLLAERGLKITKVANDTGISRTTLTALFQNHNRGIQLETLNALCMYLGVGPKDLLDYVPFDVIISDIKADFEEKTCEVSITVAEKRRKSTFIMPGKIEWTCDNQGKICSFHIELEFWNEGANPSMVFDASHENEILLCALKKLPLVFLKDVEEEILYAVLIEYANRFPEQKMSGGILSKRGVDASFCWPREISENE